MATPTVTHETTHPETGSRRRSAWIAAVVLAAGAVIALVAWFAMDGDSTPTVTFDGEAAAYDGPTSFEAGEVTFVFDSSAYEPGLKFIFLATLDESITPADTEGPHTDPRPPWEDTGVIAPMVTVRGDTPDARIVERTVRLEAGHRYVLSALTDMTGDNYVHFVAFIDVD